MARAPLLLALLCACAAAAGSANAAAGRKMVGVYELKAGDFSVGVTNWGATITSVVLPDSKGAFDFPLLLLLLYLSRKESIYAWQSVPRCTCAISQSSPPSPTYLLLCRPDSLRRGFC
jgi:hypothetical protein